MVLGLVQFVGSGGGGFLGRPENSIQDDPLRKSGEVGLLSYLGPTR